MTWALTIGRRAPQGSVIHLPAWVIGRRPRDRTACGRVIVWPVISSDETGGPWPLCRQCARSIKNQIEWQTELLAEYGIDR